MSSSLRIAVVRERCFSVWAHVMQQAEAPDDTGWRTKKRNLPQSKIKKRPAPRPPSYVQTQAETPGYIRIRRLCDALERDCNAAGADRVALEEARRVFCAGMKSHMAMAARSLLDSMSSAKQLVLLVAEQIKRASTFEDSFEDATDFNRLLKCFPLRGNERDYSHYYARVAAIESEVAMEAAIRRDEEDKQKAAQGITRVTWDESDDEFSSGVVYGFTGGAGHGHGGPGL